MIPAPGSGHDRAHRAGEVSRLLRHPLSKHLPSHKSDPAVDANSADIAPGILTLPELRGLGGVDDRELLAIASSLPRASGRPEGACEQMVDRYRGWPGPACGGTETVRKQLRTGCK